MSALCQKRTFSPYSITLSALARRLGGIVSPSILQFSPKLVQPMNFLCLTVVSDFADFDDFDWQVLNNAGGAGWSRQTVYLLLRPSRFWP